MLFKRSTRDIVARRRRKEEDRTDGGQPAEEHGAKKAGSAPRFLSSKLRVLAIALSALLVVLLLALLISLTSCKGGAPMTGAIPEGQAVFALPVSPALCSEARAGDIVAVYDGGTAIAQLRYVRVYAVADGALLLLLDDAQARALHGVSDSAAALVSCGDARRAEELLALQARINAPHVSLSLPEEVTLAPGDARALVPEITLEPEDGILPELLWSTENATVASVSDGTVTAHTVGQTVLTAQCGDARATCTVSVGVSLTGIQLDKTQLTLLRGETTQIVASAEPADATDFHVTWESNNTAVAVVDETGNVTTGESGTAVITARCGEIFASCTVTVGVHAELAQLDKQILPLVIGQNAVLTPTVHPASGVIDTAAWESSDPAIATVDETGKVTAVGAGTATITFRCGNAQASCTVMVAAHAPQ